MKGIFSRFVPGYDILAVEISVHEEVEVLPGDVHPQLALELLQRVLLILGRVIELLSQIFIMQGNS